VNETKCRTIVAARSGGVCEVCGARRADSMHHRVKRGRGGPWTPSNILHTCGSGTTGCHGRIEAHPAIAADFGYDLPTGEVPTTVPVWLRNVHGWAWWLLDDEGCLAWTDRDAPAVPFVHMVDNCWGRTQA
jgi:hypothetical protein